MTRIQPKGGFTKSSCGANDGSRQDQTWKGSTWDTFPIKQNQQGGFQRNSIFPHFADFRVWEIQLRRVGRRKGDFFGERPNIARTSNLWVRCVVAKGNISTMHATQKRRRSPRSTFLRVFTKIQPISHIYALIRKKIQNKKLFLDAKQTKSTQALNILDSRPVYSPSTSILSQPRAFGPFFVFFLMFHYFTRFKSAKRARPLLSLL